jgi:hypothetical protein
MIPVQSVLLELEINMLLTVVYLVQQEPVPCSSMVKVPGSTPERETARQTDRQTERGWQQFKAPHCRTALVQYRPYSLFFFVVVNRRIYMHDGSEFECATYSKENEKNEMDHLSAR